MYMNLFARAAIAKCIVLTLGVALAHQASATDLTVHLVGTATLSRKTVQYQCDAAGAKMGLPAKPFPVEYITGAGNSLGGRSGGAGFIDICGCDLRLWRALCGPAIHLVGSWWRGYIFFGLDVRPDEFYLQACCPLVRTRQNPSAFHRFAWPPIVKRITQSS
jgi:hypothetical protein